MTHLILWRHAEAVDGYPDHARALTPRGEQQAKHMARWLNRFLPTPYRILSSPATRTLQTAHALAEEVETHPLLHVGSSPREILQAIGWPEMPMPTVVVGHQPTLGQVAALLLSGITNDWSVPKGALWWITQRERDLADQVVLRAMLSPEFIRD